MTDVLPRLRIFVASPKDCSGERSVIRRLVMSDPTIQTTMRNLDVTVELFGWEDITPDAGRPQSLINAAVAKFDPNWFVFLFWHRFGSDAGDGMTGTEEEWNIALQLKQQYGDGLSVSAYFNQATAEGYEVDDQQLKALNEFKENTFKNFRALTMDFNGPKDFEDKFRSHLTEKLLNLSPKIPREIPYIPEHY
jgi:hypothetical protein